MRKNGARHRYAALAVAVLLALFGSVALTGCGSGNEIDTFTEFADGNGWDVTDDTGDKCNEILDGDKPSECASVYESDDDNYIYASISVFDKDDSEKVQHDVENKIHSDMVEADGDTDYSDVNELSIGLEYTKDDAYYAYIFNGSAALYVEAEGDNNIEQAKELIKKFQKKSNAGVIVLVVVLVLVVVAVAVVLVMKNRKPAAPAVPGQPMPMAPAQYAQGQPVPAQPVPAQPMQPASAAPAPAAPVQQQNPNQQ
ncbi:MAG: hypothetical protein PUF97_04280 [Bifidobacteriaceae bacterium]|nr:hypothetical protein [Bifidobacteriaceae bacterium]